MKQLTPRQQQVLDLIRRYLQNQGMPPTRAEMAQALGLRSANAVEDHLKALVRKGHIEILSGRNRNIRLLERPGLVLESREAGLPLVGRVAAGTPMLAEQNVDGYYTGAELFRPRAHYLLRVQGMSMRDVGIADGDLLAVHRTAEARNGQIVVARLEDEVTVKRFERVRHRVWLRPENPDYTPIEIDLRQHELVIEGLAVGVIHALS
ncbi:transcriptional repressor LexA [Candidatus Entotheonella palauensis]|uniref:LexA repressor n=1 Tax=Candidatus Entotheonella gemina TaxID=1429439 RepID=W4LES7_9BACT|nr:transcriptional repressor LexA [Candidatus Entotheonella palauensis]ETW96603.1 MAG: LexA repressor [Candidatus Entotheonella gemina]